MILWGANCGGYGVTRREPPEEAFARILDGFGRLQIVRWFPNRFFAWGDIPAWLQGRALCANLGNDVAGVLQGKYDADLADLAVSANRRLILTFAHEPEDEVAQGTFTMPDWQRAQRRCATIVRDAKNPRVSFGPLLMGVTYHPTRYKAAAPGNQPAKVWLDFPLTECRFLGADLYQWGKDDATADKASEVLLPFLGACDQKGKRAVVGELGTRRVAPQYDPGITDAARARYLTDAISLFDSNGSVTAVMYYESDRGDPTKVPWCLLPSADGRGVQSPKAAAVWRRVCTR